MSNRLWGAENRFGSTVSAATRSCSRRFVHQILSEMTDADEVWG